MTQTKRESTSRFHVPAMDCATEKQLIANRLERVDGIAGADYDLMGRIVTVRHRDGDAMAVEAALRDIGMKPRRLGVAATTPHASDTTSRFYVPAMDCATEKELIAKRLEKVKGLVGVDYDLLERIVTVRHAVGAAPQIEHALDEIGMKPKRVEKPGAGAKAAAATSAGATPKTEGDVVDEVSHARRDAWLLGVSGVAAVAAEIVAWTTERESSPVVIGLAVASILTGGIKTLRKGFVALRTFTLNINLLMTIAVAGAIAIQQWPEAAMVTFLFAVAELIEVKSTDRARDAIRALMALAPETAWVNRQESWIEVHANEVVPGERVRVRPGERVPLDGKISEGKTSIDQAPITGESVPVDKQVGDPVFAGTINQQGAIEVEVTAGSGDSTLARIGRIIREAQSQEAPTQRFVDRFARYYTPIVVLFAIAIATVPPIAFGLAFEAWLYKALVLLVIACPCALVISTPVTVVSGLASAARRGILVKGGVYLEQARRLRVVALDKTGTLTHGKPKLTDVIPLGASSRDDLLQRAASLEATSAHPIAHAVTAGWTGALLEVQDVKSTDGKGIEGDVGGRRLGIGSERFAVERNAATPAVQQALAKLEAEGKSVMVVWDDSGALGVIGVADTIRDTSVEAIKRLHERGIKLVMLTGDNPTTAKAIGKLVGIDEVRANLMPEDKLAIVDELASKNGPVGMVGDGVNDAPALAKAAIGFSMGAAGSDTALETADVAMMKDDLRGLADLVELSDKTASTLRVNITLAIGTKAVFFALAMFGVATLWMAVFADMGASLLVAGNGLRLLRAKL